MLRALHRRQDQKLLFLLLLIWCFLQLFNSSSVRVEEPHRRCGCTTVWRPLTVKASRLNILFNALDIESTFAQPLLQIRLWLLFNSCKDIRDAFQKRASRVLIQCFSFPTVSWLAKSSTYVWHKASVDSSHCGDSHDQLSCAIAGLAPSLWLPQVTENVKDIVGTVVVRHCAATVLVHVRSQCICGHCHRCGRGAVGCGGYHHQRGGGGWDSDPSVVARAGLRQSPVHGHVLQIIAVQRLVIVQHLPLLVHGLPAVEDPEHRRSLVDN